MTRAIVFMAIGALLSGMIVHRIDAGPSHVYETPNCEHDKAVMSKASP